MSVDQRSPGTYRVRRKCGDLRVSVTVHGTREQAELLDAAVGLSLTEHGCWPPPASSPLAHLVPNTQRRVRPSLREALARAAKGAWAVSAYGPQAVRIAGDVVRLFESLGRPALEDIGSDEIEHLKAWCRKRGLSASTVNAHLSALSTLYKYARRAPALTAYRPDIDRVPNRQRRERILTHDEEEEMVAYFSAKGCDDMLDMCLLALDTGMRQGELLRLSVADIAGDGAAIMVPGTKSYASDATLPLTARAAQVIERRLAWLRRRDTGTLRAHALLFPSLSKMRIHRLWQGFRDHLGLADDPGFTFHCLRHTTATRLVDAGLDLERVQRFMRHESVATTLKYVKRSAKRLADARDALECA